MDGIHYVEKLFLWFPVAWNELYGGLFTPVHTWEEGKRGLKKDRKLGFFYSFGIKSRLTSREIFFPSLWFHNFWVLHSNRWEKACKTICVLKYCNSFHQKPFFCPMQNGKSVICMQWFRLFSFTVDPWASFCWACTHSTKPLFSKKSAHVHFILNDNCTSLYPKAWSSKNLNRNSSEKVLEAVDSEARPAHPIFYYFLLFSQSICLHGPKKLVKVKNHIYYRSNCVR